MKRFQGDQRSPNSGNPRLPLMQWVVPDAQIGALVAKLSHVKCVGVTLHSCEDMLKIGLHAVQI